MQEAQAKIYFNLVLFNFISQLYFYFIFLISNKNSLIRKRHPSTQGVYRGEQSRTKITKVK